ncbi:hypothetical protein, partial [Pseudomonas viridiflava]|uniref:hypothetical protein n=1 Tax=Pseudomonas viridiflava TaxID=33069 RepID=UPI00197D24CE
ISHSNIHVHSPYCVISQKGSGKLNKTHLQTHLLVDNLLRPPLWAESIVAIRPAHLPNPTPSA